MVAAVAPAPTDDAPTVAQALSAVMGDVQAVRKGDRNTQQGFAFRGIDAVVNAVGPALRRHGVLVLPSVVDARYGEFSTKSGTVMHTCTMHVTFTFVGPAGDTLACSTMGESADAGDKATAKAHSVAFRTALLQALCIPTDEPDPDSQTYERVAPPPPAPAMAASQQTAIAEGLAALDEDATAELKAWWKVQQFPRLDSLDRDQAEAVLDRLAALQVGADS